MDIQARLYWHIIKQNLDKYPEYKDYKLENYRFIVVNKNTLTPLVWEFEYTRTDTTLHLGKDEKIELRHPFAIGSELRHYLDTNPKVPEGIKLTSDNSLRYWINTL